MKRTVIIMLILLSMVFGSVQLFLWYGQSWMQAHNIDRQVVSYSNTGLFILSLLAAFMHISGSRSTDPYVFYRYAMLVTLSKLFICAVALLVYVKMSGAARNKNGVYASVLVYALYTVVEVVAALQMSNRKDEENKRTSPA